MRNDNKMLIFSLLIVIIIFICGFSISSYLKKTTNKLTNYIKYIESSITSEKWNNANKSINTLISEWKDNEDKWALFINHREIDNISTTLDMTAEYIKYKDSEDSYAYLSSLKRFFEHVPEMEEVKLKNIF